MSLRLIPLVLASCFATAAPVNAGSRAIGGNGKQFSFDWLKNQAKQLARKDYAKAAEEFDRHLAAHLNDDRALFARGQARAGLGRLEEALQDWERVVALESRLAPQARQRITETRARLGR